MIALLLKPPVPASRLLGHMDTCKHRHTHTWTHANTDVHTNVKKILNKSLGKYTLKYCLFLSVAVGKFFFPFCNVYKFKNDQKKIKFLCMSFKLHFYLIYYFFRLFFGSFTCIPIPLISLVPQVLTPAVPPPRKQSKQTNKHKQEQNTQQQNSASPFPPLQTLLHSSWWHWGLSVS